MPLTSLPVIGGCALLAVLWWLVPARARGLVSAVAGLSLIVAWTSVYALLHVVFAVGVAVAAAALVPTDRRPRGKRRALLVVVLVGLVGHLLAWKVLEVVAVPGGPWLPDAVDPGLNPMPGADVVLVPLGLSFLTFRLIHFVVERARGTLDDAPATDVAGWLFFPPLLLAGPLMRFGPFRDQLRATADRGIGLPAVNLALLRIGTGLVKKLVLADALGAWAGPVLLEPAAHPAWAAAAAIYAAGIQLYLDFSGYSDVAIGLGALFGLKVPENFDWPLLATDLATLWRRWHITLYTFFRDYVLLPFFGRRATPAKLVVGVFVTIFLFQIWHRLTPAFVFLGLYHAAGVVGVQRLQRLRRKHRWLHTGLRKVPDNAARMVTLTYFCLGVVVFMTGPSQLLTVLGRIVAW